MALDDLYKKILVLDEFDIVAETLKIIQDNQDYVTHLLQTQLASGKDGKGNDVTIFGKEDYSPETVFLKKEYGSGALGKVTDRITNYFSGSFYMNMYIRTGTNGFEIESDVSYFEEIIARSGEAIMELSEDNMKLLMEEVVSPLIQEIFTLKFNS
jgi:hypothetical protein